MTAPVLSHEDLLAAGYIPGGTDRRQKLRTLAEEHEDFPAILTARLVRTWASPTLTPADRDAAWEALTSATALLDGLCCGAVEPRTIVPGANPNCAHTVATETLEQDITDALDLLLDDPRGEDACPECRTGVQVAGRMERDTGHMPAGCSAGCGWFA